jgi:hypothetical protein
MQKNFRRFPERRLTSVFDLEKTRWASYGLHKVSEYKLSLLPQTGNN